ncbi:DUF3089 domain-containing protein [Erythrobacter sp. MTPC3]|uniref:DUF3089 domain-containing protein n=1 Tax=Erythrobacter sp. MTPC3 TaxID=3056564 RepID=UPI0036F28BA6
MAKKFLYFIAACIVLFLIGRIGYELFQDELAEMAFVPSAEFTPTEPLEANAYQDPALWISRPGFGVNDPARWQPSVAAAAGEPGTEAKQPANTAASEVPNFAIFFIHPTSYLSRESWNAPIEEAADSDADTIARTYVRGMASPFNKASEIWAPRYRQATMGAFLTDAPEGEQAIDAAYADVLEAYRYFLSSLDADTPIVLAGHSQGSLHLLRLLREEIAGSSEADRLVAAYAVGWPVSIDHDLPAMGIDACATPSQTGCLLSWSSFAEPADPSSVMKAYSNSVGFDGELRGDSTILCTNPITGTFGGSAPESQNLGTLVPDDSMSSGDLVPGAVPARCDERGLLLIGDPPELGSYVLPGNNYHVYDIPLFWANTQADVARRVRAMDTAN